MQAHKYLNPEHGTRRLIQAIEGLQVHNHLCLIYQTPAEQFAAVLPFVRSGLQRGERCIYIADENTGEGVFEAMRSAGIEVERHLRSGALLLASKREFYLKQGRFDPDWMIGFLKEHLQGAKAAGYQALRVTAEMTWALGPEPGMDRLLEYEAKLNCFFPQHEALAICQYNRLRFAPRTIKGVIETHPLVVAGGVVGENRFYVPPDEYLKESDINRQVDRMLEHIQDVARGDHELRQSQRRLEINIRQLEVEIAHRQRLESELLARTAVLGERERQLATLLSNLPGMAYRCLNDRQRTMEFVSDGAKTLTGFSADDLIHNRCPAYGEQIHPGDRDAVWSQIQSGLERREPFLLNYRLRPASGDERWVWEQSQGIYTAEGKLAALEGFIVDITESKRIEQALQDSEERYRRIFEVASDAIFLMDRETGRFIDVNPMASKLYGYNREELLALDPFELTAELEKTRRAVEESHTFVPKRWHRRKDGTLFLIEMSVNYFEFQGHQAQVAAVRDITSRQRAEEALREAQALTQQHLRFSETLLAAVPIPVFYKDRAGRYLGCNPAFSETTGLELEQIKGKTIQELWCGEFGELYLQKDLELFQTPEVSQAYEGVITDRHGEQRTALFAKRAFLDEQGEVLGLVGTFLDITTRKQAEEELRQSREQIQALSRRLVEVEETARRNLARELHDRVGQNLTSLNINLSIIKSAIAAEASQRVEGRLRDSMRLISETMDHVRDVMADLRPAVLDDYGLEAALRWSCAQFGARTGVPAEVQSAGAVPRLPATAEIALFRIVQEALTNVARHARARKVLVALRVVERCLHLTVADDGVGFDPAESSRPGEPTTWGMATMRERAEAVGAKWRVESSAGRGTKIIVEFCRLSGT